MYVCIYMYTQMYMQIHLGIEGKYLLVFNLNIMSNATLMEMQIKKNKDELPGLILDTLQ